MWYIYIGCLIGFSLAYASIRITMDKAITPKRVGEELVVIISVFITGMLMWLPISIAILIAYVYRYIIGKGRLDYDKLRESLTVHGRFWARDKK